MATEDFKMYTIYFLHPVLGGATYKKFKKEENLLKWLEKRKNKIRIDIAFTIIGRYTHTYSLYTDAITTNFYIRKNNSALNIGAYINNNEVIWINV